jgi:hypothetical protein
LQTSTNILLSPWNVLDASHFARWTKAATSGLSKAHNIAAKITPKERSGKETFEDEPWVDG